MSKDHSGGWFPSLLIGLIVSILLWSPSQSINAVASNNGKGNPKIVASPTASVAVSASKKSIVTSTWLSPKSETSTAMFHVTPGSAISLKFRLFSSGNEIKNTGSVNVSAISASCIGITPAPTSSNLARVLSPGKSSGSASYALRYSSSGFSAVWKTQKDAIGCFKFQVSFANSTLLTSDTLFYFRKK